MIDLLLVTHDRTEYLCKTLPQVLSSNTDFRLYIWDNGSGPGTKDFLSDARDERIVSTILSKNNAGQEEAFRWFLAHSQGELVGKLDDDVLLPPDWMDRIAPIALGHEKAGMLSCWIFMPEDWRSLNNNPNCCPLGDVNILRWPSVGGCAFLVRRGLAQRYLTSVGYGLPVDQIQMSADGYYCGNPLPLILAHHMDDPRSEHLCYTDLNDSNASLTWRKRRFSREEYVRWIARDALTRQVWPFKRELRMILLGRQRTSSILRKVERRALGWLRERTIRRAEASEFLK